MCAYFYFLRSQTFSKRLWNLSLHLERGFSWLWLRGQAWPITHTRNQSVFSCKLHPSISVSKTVWEQQRVFCISVCGVVRWFLRGLTPVLSVTVALWNPTETQSGLTGSRGLDALPSPSPFVPETQTHSLEMSHSCVTQAGVKTVQRWEDDVMAPRRGTCDPGLDPVQVHTQRGIHTQHTVYMCTILLMHTKTLNISSLEITLAVLRKQRSCYVVFYEGLWANGWPGYGHTLTGFGGWDWTCYLKGNVPFPTSNL